MFKNIKALWENLNRDVLELRFKPTEQLDRAEIEITNLRTGRFVFLGHIDKPLNFNIEFTARSVLIDNEAAFMHNNVGISYRIKDKSDLKDYKGYVYIQSYPGEMNLIKLRRIGVEDYCELKANTCFDNESPLKDIISDYFIGKYILVKKGTPLDEECSGYSTIEHIYGCDIGDSIMGMPNVVDIREEDFNIYKLT